MAKDPEVLLVDLWKNHFDSAESNVLYPESASFKSTHTVIAADISLPGEQRNED